MRSCSADIGPGANTATPAADVPTCAMLAKAARANLYEEADDVVKRLGRQCLSILDGGDTSHTPTDAQVWGSGGLLKQELNKILYSILPYIRLDSCALHMHGPLLCVCRKNYVPDSGASGIGPSCRTRLC